MPTQDLVRDYFRWRNEDAHRNALSAHCYWMLRNAGAAVNAATEKLLGMSTADKNELLFRGGINFNELPNWQKRGTGLYWETYEKPAMNPKTGESVTTTRRRIKQDFDLPMGEGYGRFVEDLVAREAGNSSH